MRADSTTQSAVRRVVLEATEADDRLQVTQTVASHGWGDVLYVDVYGRSPEAAAPDDLDSNLRRTVAAVSGRPYARVTINWRLNI
jgi:hypothetical protein